MAIRERAPKPRARTAQKQTKTRRLNPRKPTRQSRSTRRHATVRYDPRTNSRIREYEDRIRILEEIATELKELKREKKGHDDVMTWFGSLRNKTKIMLAAGIVISGLVLSTAESRESLATVSGQLQGVADAMLKSVIGGLYVVETATGVSSMLGTAVSFVKSGLKSAYGLLLKESYKRGGVAGVMTGSALKAVKEIPTVDAFIDQGVKQLLTDYKWVANVKKPSSPGGVTDLVAEVCNPEYSESDFVRTWGPFILSLHDAYKKYLKSLAKEGLEMTNHTRIDAQDTLVKALRSFRILQRVMRRRYIVPNRSNRNPCHTPK